MAAHEERVIAATRCRFVSLGVEGSCIDAVRWWEGLTANGGEGMVVKPRSFVARGARGLLQPALKVRGREYLRIIYGPEYDVPERGPPSERIRSSAHTR
jgi:protein phosphatase